MIGVIGPRDSVAQVREVADQAELDVPLLTRTYRTPKSVVDLARELDESCSVILFTGRVPFALAGAALTTRARLEYIPHEGLDLMRVLAQLLVDPQVSTPLRISLDSIDPVVAEEVFLDVGVGLDHFRSIPLVLGEGGVGFSAAAVGREHQQLVLAGDVDVSVTCLDSVHRWLLRNDVPVRRITHARMVIRDALRRCVLEARLSRASASQVAVTLISSATLADLDDSRRSLVEALVRDAAAEMNADVVDRTGELAKLVTTRGAVEIWLNDASRRDVMLREAEFAGLTDIGVGIGETIALAEQNAHRALLFAQRDGQPYIQRDDGTSVAAGTSSASYQARVTAPGMLRRSREVGLAPVSLQRLVRALQRTDSHAVTASRLASMYGVSPRTARRLLGRLVSGGYAEVAGAEHGAGAGRPQAVYRVHLDRLVSSL